MAGKGRVIINFYATVSIFLVVVKTDDADHYSARFSMVRLEAFKHVETGTETVAVTGCVGCSRLG